MNVPDRLPVGDNLRFSMERKRRLMDLIDPQGEHQIELHRKGRIIHKENIHNVVTDNARLQILDAFFQHGAQPTHGFVMSIIDDAAYGGTSVTDTYTHHPGWNEFIQYQADTGVLFLYRGIWTPCAAVVGKTYNVTPISFSFTDNGRIRGIWVAACGVSEGIVKNQFNDGSFGLWSTALLTNPLDVEIEDVLKVIYTVQI